jgi:hypothetical protein
MTDRPKIDAADVEQFLVESQIIFDAHGTTTVDVRAICDLALRGLEQQLISVADRFLPLGDNHHNAALCPYCQPQLAAHDREVAAKALRDAAEECLSIGEIDRESYEWFLAKADAILRGE